MDRCPKFLLNTVSKCVSYGCDLEDYLLVKTNTEKRHQISYTEWNTGMGVKELRSYRSCGARKLRRYRDGNMPIRKRTLVRRYGIREVMAMAKGDVIWKVNECLGAQSLRVLVGERPTLSEAHTWVGAYITKLRFVSLCSTRLHGVLHNPPSPTAFYLYGRWGGAEMAWGRDSKRLCFIFYDAGAVRGQRKLWGGAEMRCFVGPLGLSVRVENSLSINAV